MISYDHLAVMAHHMGSAHADLWHMCQSFFCIHQQEYPCEDQSCRTWAHQVHCLNEQMLYFLYHLETASG